MRPNRETEMKKKATTAALSSAPHLSISLVHEHFGLTHGETRGVVERANLKPVMSIPSGRGLSHFYDRDELLAAMQDEVAQRAQRAQRAQAAGNLFARGAEPGDEVPPWGRELLAEVALLREQCTLTHTTVERMAEAWGVQAGEGASA